MWMEEKCCHSLDFSCSIVAIDLQWLSPLLWLWFRVVLQISYDIFLYTLQRTIWPCPSSDVNINITFIDMFRYLFYWVFYGCLMFWNISENEVSAFSLCVVNQFSNGVFLRNVCSLCVPVPQSKGKLIDWWQSAVFHHSSYSRQSRHRRIMKIQPHTQTATLELLLYRELKNYQQTLTGKVIFSHWAWFKLPFKS